MSFVLTAALFATAAASRCPAGDFAGFVRRFTDDAAVQRRYTATPLIDEHIDAQASPEPRTATRRLDVRTLRFPVMPNRQAQRKDGLAASTKVLADGDREVTLAKADTGYQIRYRFQRSGDCWQLVRRSDGSL